MSISSAIEDSVKDLELGDELKERLRQALERLAYFTQRRLVQGDLDDTNIKNCVAQISAIAGQHAQAVKAKLNARIQQLIAQGFDVLFAALG